MFYNGLGYDSVAIWGAKLSVGFLALQEKLTSAKASPGRSTI